MTTLDEMATKYVGDGKTEFYFVSSRASVIAVFIDRDDALNYAKGKGLYIEGPEGMIDQ